jgi:hypothetical protein
MPLETTVVIAAIILITCVSPGCVGIYTKRMRARAAGQRWHSVSPFRGDRH